jgi:hypothetical protein
LAHCHTLIIFICANRAPRTAFKTIRFRMKNLFLLFLLAPCALLFSSAFFSCGKEKPEPDPTIIKGKITDFVTGLPIKRATIWLVFAKPNASGDYQVYREELIHTDSAGLFEHSFLGSPYSFTILANGYLPKPFFRVYPAQVNDFQVALIPRDGFLRVTLSNTSTTTKQLAVKIWNNTYNNEFQGATRLDKCPATVAPGGSYIETIGLPADGYPSYIYWGGSANSSYLTYPFRDTVMLSRGDTIDYMIAL